MIEQDGIIALTKMQQSPEFSSFSDWHTAFITFVGIYVQKHPNQSSALMKYMLAIQNLATSAGDAHALNYDRAFRQLRARHPARVPWDRLHPEFKLDCNKGSTCLYAHKCQRCRGAHARISCI
ncbi:uncharacterized protein LOC126809771 [Patella vulgata]|uniref:uncharacterized protein LOC126809771 n=1 Tax=Patella vulgata TaxID=6465 RepID=UPI0024A7EB6B|nr:uncharacterized protein LOC126809771 [Patella vulgata]